MTPLLQSFAQFRDEMVILNQVNCPRDPAAPGDHHGAGMMTMMTGRKPIIMPGTSDTGDPNAKNFVGSDVSIDQLLLQKSMALQGTSIPSLQLSAYRPSSTGLPVFRVVSYGGKAAPLFPESRPDVAFANVFGALTPGMSQDPAALARLHDQNKSVLDYLYKDMGRLQHQAPRSQVAKLDAHMTAIRSLEMDSRRVAVGARLAPPSRRSPRFPMPPRSQHRRSPARHGVAPTGFRLGSRSPFQCDVTACHVHIRARQLVPALSRDGPGFPGPTPRAPRHFARCLPLQSTLSRVDEYYSESVGRAASPTSRPRPRNGQC